MTQNIQIRKYLEIRYLLKTAVSFYIRQLNDLNVIFINIVDISDTILLLIDFHNLYTLLVL